MKKFILNLVIFGLIINCSLLKAQTIWTGPTMTFTKANFADWTLEENQDRITNNVWITRADIQGIFNIVTESSYTEEFSPEDTEWAFGTTANAFTLSYDPWEEAIGTPPDMMNLDMVVHLITDDIYIDIKFTAWTGGGNGGGFTYERSTDQILGINDIEAQNEIKLYPNPSSDYISFSNQEVSMNYCIYNAIGSKIVEGYINPNDQILVQNLKTGVYFIQLENGRTMKFIKI